MKNRLIAISEVDRKYLNIRPLVVTMFLNSNIDPQDLYSIVQKAMENMPLFSSKVIEEDGNLYLKYEENCFKYNYMETDNDEISEIHNKESFMLGDLHQQIDDEIAGIGKPLTSITLTNVKGGKAVLTISYSHVLGDAQTGKMFIFSLGKLMQGKSLPKIESSRCFPFEKEEEFSFDGINYDYKKHKISGLGKVRDTKVTMINMKSDELKDINDNFKKSYPDIDINNIDIVSALIIKEYTKELIPKAKKMKFKVPINVRFIQKDKGNSYVGNAYYSVVFDFSKEELEKISIEELICEINSKIHQHKDKDYLQGEIEKKKNNKVKEEEDYTEIIISNVGNVSSTYKILGAGLIEKILTISSDPNVFVVQKGAAGYNLQVFVSN